MGLPTIPRAQQESLGLGYLNMQNEQNKQIAFLHR
jgi:hypothetical protein